MSRSISIILLVLFLIVAGFAYLNYSRLNQIQEELTKRDALLEESNQSIEQQGSAIGEIEEKISEATTEKAEVEKIEEDFKNREIEMLTKLENYQEELQKLRVKLDETIQQSELELQTIAQLSNEKSRLEVLLNEQESQWQSKEAENQQVISSLQQEINKYKDSIGSVNKKIEDLEEYLNKEIKKRQDLEKEITKYEDNIAELDAKLSLEQDNEIRAQEISQLMATKQKLEAEIKDKDALLSRTQKEYEEFQREISTYQEKMTDLKKEVKIVEEQKSIIDEIQANINYLKEEKSKLEASLYDKEEEWSAKEEASKKTIDSLQAEVREYESSLKEIGNEMLSLKQELTEKATLKEKVLKEVDQLEDEINNLRQELAGFQGLKESYKIVFDQLQSNKELLEKELEEKGLEIEQQEYEELLKQITIYQKQVEEIKEELNLAKKGEESQLNAQFAQMKKDIESLEKELTEKEDTWERENRENRELVSYLQKQLEKYQEEIEGVKIDSSLLKEEMAGQIELQNERIARIKDREEQIAELASQISDYAVKMEEYEAIVQELRTKLQKQGDLSYQEQQELMNRLLSLTAEREMIQDKINQYHEQINKLEYEIAELQNKLAGFEEKNEYYEVKSGDCLWTIAKERYREGIAWTKIFKANQELIENPDLIYPYQQIVIPD